MTLHIRKGEYMTGCLLLTGTLGTLDWAAIGAYFAVILGVAWWVVKKRKDTAADYFLAGRNLGWWVIGASIFASNIGSEHIVGLAGSGAADGVAMAHYELHAWCLLTLAWVFVPFYSRCAGIHDAGISRTTFLHEFAVRPFYCFAYHLCCLEDCRGHFRRRRRFRNTAA